VMLGLPWISLGIAEECMHYAIAYAKERKVPGSEQPLAQMQWVQHAVADMSIQLEAARSLAWRGCIAADEGRPEFIGLMQQAKVAANRAARDIAAAALEICGGAGYFRTRPLERLIRDAMSGMVMALSEPVVKTSIGQTLLGINPLG